MLQDVAQSHYLYLQWAIGQGLIPCLINVQVLSAIVHEVHKRANYGKWKVKK